MRVNHRTIVLLTAGIMLVYWPCVRTQALEGRSAGDWAQAFEGRSVGGGAQAYEGRTTGDREQSPEGRSAGDRGAGNASVMSYRAAEPNFRGINDPSGRYLRMNLPGHHHTSETGKPELPVYSRLVEVPAGMDVRVSLSGVSSRRIRFADQGAGNAELFPAQPARTKNEARDEKVTIKDRNIYATRGFIGHDTVVITYEGIYRGRKLANIAVYPAFYDPKGGFIDLITSMEVDIRFEPSPSKGDETEIPDYDKGGYASDSYITGYTDKPVRMIIVTDSSFSKQIAPLIRWKMLKGIRSTVIYRKTGPADSVYADLKRRIAAVYASSFAEGNPVQYLLIAGDPAIIPTSRGTTNVSDLYYGEFDGEGDYIPDLFIGRLPASDTAQMRGMVRKIIDYESFNYKPDNNFWAGALATAGNAPGFELYMNGQVKYIYSNYLSQDTSLNAVRWLYPESPLKDDSLLVMFNGGLGILNYTGHGEASGFSDPVLKASMVSALTNENEYPLIIANACRTAQINVTPCLATTMVATAGKGAIGYIGCTNDSYWVDDYFWAVGPGTPGLDNTYETTGYGAFDRLFHSHKEPPGEWFYTMGQINFSGNMSVSASTSPRKKYYWETYILLGDPSLSPVIGRPDTFKIEVPDTLPQEVKALSFFSTPFSYAALTDFDTLWDAKFVSPSGNVSLAIPAGVKDSCLLVVTGQNMLPLIKTIYFGQVNGAFITLQNILLDDPNGNGDGNPDYGEEINLTVTVRNIGQVASFHLSADLTVTSGSITVGSGSANIGVLLPGASYTIMGKFTFTVSDEVEDGELASLLLRLTDNEDEYRFGIDMTLHAPALKIISAVHDDTHSGNSNFLPDPGETINMDIRIRNEGSSAVSGQVTVTPTGPWLSVEEPVLPSGTILPGEEKTISFEAVISDLASAGTNLPFEVEFASGSYDAKGSWSLRTGKTRETWEFNRFDVFPWLQKEQYPWTITSSSSYENTHSARSGIIPDKTETILSIYVNNPVADTLSFYSRVSSEPVYDELIFRIDSMADMQVSGDTPWALRRLVLQPGVHYLEWVYRKDVSLSGGNDAVWIDQITFPDISFLEADLSIDSVYAPPASAVLTDVAVSGRVINFGRNVLTSFPLAYRINDGEPVIETFFIKIDPGDTVNVVFTRKCNLQPDVSYMIYIMSRLPEDGYAGNDTAYVSFIKSGTGEEIREESVRIMPNPFRESFVLELDNEEGRSIVIELIDTGGRVVLSSAPEMTPGRNRIPFDCRHLAGGVYTLRINQGGKSISLKVVKIQAAY